MCKTTTQIDRDFLIRVSDIDNHESLYSSKSLLLLLGTPRFEHVISKAYRAGRDVFTYKHRALSLTISFVSR